ncbi:MAG TPA: hypothetical protein VNF92_06430 [Gemmatimonadaceae bacterium]|nr:hypothetical protein [Gemmatimonadaceae bacterium]
MLRRDETLAAPVLPAPRFAAGWAALTYALCTLVLAYPVFSGQFLVNPNSDQYIAGYAFRLFGAQSLRTGHGFPLWNPYIMGGLPYVAAMHGDIFYPTFLLRMLMPTDLAMSWGFIIHLFLAGCFTYGFLRAWGFGFFPSLFGGVGYMLAGQVASLASPGHDGKLFVSALLPLALWMLLLGIRDGRQWAWGGLAAVIGLAVLSPHPQMLQYMLLGSGAFALFVAFSDHEGRGRLPRDVALRRLAYALGAVVLGLVVGAVQFLPVKEYVPWSPRAGGRGGYDFATQFSMPIEEFFNTYLPQFTGMLDHYWGRNQIHLHSEYLGVSILILAGAAFGATARRGFRAFWLSTVVVSALWAMGGYTPFYHLVYATVPGSKFFRAPSIIFFMTSFAMVMLATVGIERALARRVGMRYITGWVIFGTLIALLASGGMLTNVAQTIAASFAGTQLYERVQANNGALILGAWRSFLVVGVTCGLLFAVRRERISLRAAAISIVVLSAVDLLSIDHNYWMFSPPASQLFATDSAIAYVQRQPQPGRIAPLDVGTDGIASYRDPYFYGDGFMVDHIRSITGYHGNELGDYEQLGDKVGMRYNNTVAPEFWRLTNVQYIYSNIDAPQLDTLYATQAKRPDITFTRLVGPVRNSAGSMVFLLKPSMDDPYAWVAPAIVKATEQQTLPTVLNPKFNPATVAVFDTAANVTAVKLTAVPAPLPITTSVSTYAPGHVVLDLSAPAPQGSALVVSENYYPGWRATVDGKPVAAIGRADYSLIGIALPAGARHVELNFDDAAFETGKKVTLVALALVLLLTAGGVAADRRMRG